MPPRRSYPASPPANPLDVENLLTEFLLRLPPRPSSLPRAAAVCKAWRRIVADPHFLRRFRAHHRGKAPLLGFFDFKGVFFPTLEAPDRVPASRLSVSCNVEDVVACRDGLLLCSRGLQLQVLDPMTGDRSAILTREDKLPKPVTIDLVVDSTGVERLCFRLFAISTDADETKLSVSVYSSDSGTWAHSVETLVCEFASSFSQCPSTLVGNAFYWSLMDIHRILRYDLETQTLAIIEIEETEEEGPQGEERLIAESVSEGCLFGTESSREDKPIQIWMKETILSNAGEWVIRKTVLLDTLLPPELKTLGKAILYIKRFEKENNVIFGWTPFGIYMIDLESAKFTKVVEEANNLAIHPYSSFVTAGFTNASQ